MTTLNLVESVHTSNSLAFRRAYPEVRILKDFKCRVFGSADSKGVTHAFSVSADCKGVSEKQVADRELFGSKERTGDLIPPWGRSYE